jgi:hypothetical protein
MNISLFIRIDLKQGRAVADLAIFEYWRMPAIQL